MCSVQGAFGDEGGDRLERFAVVDPQAGDDVGHRAWAAREQRQDVRAGRDPVAAGGHGVGDHLGVGREQTGERPAEEPCATGATDDSAGGRTAVLSWIRSGAMRTRQLSEPLHFGPPRP